MLHALSCSVGKIEKIKETREFTDKIPMLMRNKA